MAATPSTMHLSPGSPAPAVDLADASGRLRSVEDLAGPQGLLVAFLCNHCPFVVHVRREFGKLADELASQGIGIVGVNSNDAGAYPDDAPAKMPAFARESGWHFPYLADPDQSVAKAYRAACTPDFFLFDASRRLVYRGRMDGARPGNNVPVTGADLRAAAQRMLAGLPQDPKALPSMGCNVKWKPGNQPEWWG